MEEKFDKTKKEYLYLIIKMYLAGRITATVFCDEFHESYDIEVVPDSLSPTERQSFEELGHVAGRFSKFKEDHSEFPGVYYTESELRDAVLHAKEQLVGNSSKF